MIGWSFMTPRAPTGVCRLELPGCTREITCWLPDRAAPTIPEHFRGCCSTCFTAAGGDVHPPIPTQRRPS